MFGYIPLNELQKLPYLGDVHIACYNNEMFEYLGENNIQANIHIKVETGMNR